MRQDGHQVALRGHALVLLLHGFRLRRLLRHLRENELHQKKSRSLKDEPDQDGQNLIPQISSSCLM